MQPESNQLLGHALVTLCHGFRLSDIEPNFTTRCGKKGAEIRPKFSNARMDGLRLSAARQRGAR
jgi:hypothetical protein